jgi:hypothetical protein
MIARSAEYFFFALLDLSQVIGASQLFSAATKKVLTAAVNSIYAQS